MRSKQNGNTIMTISDTSTGPFEREKLDSFLGSEYSACESLLVPSCRCLNRCTCPVEKFGRVVHRHESQEEERSLSLGAWEP